MGASTAALSLLLHSMGLHAQRLKRLRYGTVVLFDSIMKCL